ncbi:amino acid adenylation domain-containing protein [Ktedonosporobacter rubrisoli]|uniref:Amino acid adenylation domain-containing protein n=1 Tax=Ktedonosporobacter rubrisoli TaxID=2509675 RepID=A0A4V0YYS5_KTERU|nr:non-ribosomal peptide synthetase [Ktedonosporobacter rubrisoli]QBD77241.1 amino acid adenylation domain-containing protein [Ktedonosporobacter rubrisoli]
MQLDDLEAIYALSPMQAGMLFHSLYAPTAQVYLVQYNARLHGPLQPQRWQQAWQQVVQRHAVLRTAFVWQGIEEPVQVVGKTVHLPWRQLDGSQWSAQHLEQVLKSEREQGFDLRRAPLLRGCLIRLGPQRFHFAWTFHHLLLDGWSASLIFQEVFTIYSALTQGQELSLPLPRQYCDYINWLQEQNEEGAKQFWQAFLAGFKAPTRLPYIGKYEKFSEQPVHLGQEEAHLSVEMTIALQQMARTHSLTLNTLIQGAWALLLSRYSGEEEVVFGVTVSGRPIELDGVEQMVGLFINTVPLRVRVAPMCSLLSWLQEIQGNWLDLHQYEHSPLLQIQAWSELSPGEALFESICIFENYPEISSSPSSSMDLEIESARSFAMTNYPLSIVIGPGESLLLQISYNNKLFDALTVQCMLGHLQALLQGFLDHKGSNRRILDIPMITGRELQQLQIDWNQTVRSYPFNLPFQRLFEGQVLRTPDAVALVCGDEQITYEELNRRANQLAHHLRFMGITIEDTVGICLERSVAMLIGLLGILKAGGAYVPMEPSYPGERLAFIARDARVCLLLTQQKLISCIPRTEGLSKVLLDRDWPIIAKNNGENPGQQMRPANLAYILYTSGSTGKPKGVMIPHQGLVNYLYWCADTYDMANGHGSLVHSPLGFDLTITSLFAPLLKGQRVVLLHESESIEAFEEVLRLQGELSLLKLTPTHMDLLSKSLISRQAAQQIHTLIIGGEALHSEHVTFWQKEAPGTRLINEYGPTETVVGCSIYEIPRYRNVQGRIPIGRPIANVQLYVLDRDLQLVPVGVTGELYIGGDGLARGYLHRPDITAERFLPNPFSQEPGARLYKTGDVARYLADGNLEYLGRNDAQMKLHGFRIEPGEIEGILQRHPAICSSLVLLHEDPSGEKQLVAYLLFSEKRKVSISDLRSFLAAHLPEYMIPTSYIPLDTIPLSHNGKIDWQALPAPSRSFQKIEAQFVAPRDELEVCLTKIWEEVLAVQPIGVQHNFFTLGGNSLHAIRLLARIQQQISQKLSLSLVFQHPTIEQLAAIIRQQRATPARTPLVAIQPQGSKLPFFAVHPGSGDVLCYYDLSRHLGFDQPFYALEDPDIEQKEFPYHSLEFMATCYIEAIKSVQPEGPYLLGGYSFGGHVAYEMAQQLRRAGQDIAFLGIFDTATPAIMRDLPHDDASNIMTVVLEVLRDVPRKSAGELYSHLQNLAPDAQYAFALAEIQKAGIELPDPAAQWLRQQAHILKTRMQAIHAYYPVSYPGTLTLFRSTEMEEFGDFNLDLLLKPDRGWNELSAKVEIYMFSGYHDTILLEPCVRKLAAQLGQCLHNAQLACREKTL